MKPREIPVFSTVVIYLTQQFRLDMLAGMERVRAGLVGAATFISQHIAVEVLMALGSGIANAAIGSGSVWSTIGSALIGGAVGLLLLWIGAFTFYLIKPNQTTTESAKLFDARGIAITNPEHPVARMLLLVTLLFIVIGLGWILKTSFAAEYDIEVTALRTFEQLQIINNKNDSIYLTSLIIHAPQGKVGSFSLGMKVGPGEFGVYTFDRPRVDTETIVRLGNTWAEHLKQAELRFSGCIEGLAAFSKNDPALRMIQNSYKRNGQELGSVEDIGKLIYRIDGREKTLKIPIVVTVLKKKRCP